MCMCTNQSIDDLLVTWVGNIVYYNHYVFKVNVNVKALGIYIYIIYIYIITVIS